MSSATTVTHTLEAATKTAPESIPDSPAVEAPNEPLASSLCPPICGDGLIVGYESCEDGNAISLDDKSSDCVIEPGWTCTGNPAVCEEHCGDGYLTVSETCDDGNTLPGGCKPDYSVPEISFYSTGRSPETGVFMDLILVR